jgi:hypothetical protein
VVSTGFKNKWSGQDEDEDEDEEEEEEEVWEVGKEPPCIPSDCCRHMSLQHFRLLSVISTHCGDA